MTLFGSVTAALLLLGAWHVHGGLAWVACAPLIAASRRLRTVKGACVLGALFGVLVGGGTHAAWVAEAGQRYFSLAPAVALACAIGLVLCCGGLLGAVLGAALWCAVRVPGRWPALTAAASWVAWESLLVIVFPHYPWVSLAVTQVRMPLLAQIASVAGQEGLSFAVAASGAAIGMAFSGPSRTARMRLRWLMMAPAIAVALAAVGTVRLLSVRQVVHLICSISGIDPDRCVSEKSYPAVNQPECSITGVDAGILSGKLPARDVVTRYREASRNAVADRPTAIIWPESALPGDPRLQSELLHALRQMAAEWGAVIIAGGPRVDWASSWKERHYNSVYRIDASGPVEVYDKRALVPFAEYWPLAPMPRPRWLATQEVDAGGKPGVFATGGCRIGVLICFEAERPNLTRQLVHVGIHALVIATNDAELPKEAVAIEIAHARLRALEAGVPVLRVANRGGSIGVDRFGRIALDRGHGQLNLSVGAAQPVWAIQLAPVLLLLCWGTVAVSVGLAVRRRQ